MYEEMKQEQLQGVIASYKEKLMELWDACGFTSEQRQQYAAFYSGNQLAHCIEFYFNFV